MTHLKINKDIVSNVILPLCLDVDEGNIRATYYDGSTVDYETAEEFVAEHQLDDTDVETAILIARCVAELTEDGEHRLAVISSVTDLRQRIGTALGANGSNELADAVTDAVRFSGYCPEWGDDWGPFLANVDAWSLIELLDKAGRLEVQP